MREPAYWWRKAGLSAGLLAPFAAIYGAVAAKRMRRVGVPAGIPVLCVGNFTLGGAGKTPAAIMLAQLLAAAGETPFCLSRGYGGNATGAKRVDVHADHAREVGDEALLLARVAPTIISRNRAVGAQLAMSQGASVVVMDDGLQNASLVKDFTLAVVDRRRGIGNGRVFPAGPLRAPLAAQLERTDAVLVIGSGTGADDVAASARARALPVWHGRLVPDESAIGELKGRGVLAFAGIGDPDKFFDSATEAGITVARRRRFADHHRFTAEEAAELIMEAEHDGLVLLTTEKDKARMAGDPLTETLAARAHVLPVTLVVNEIGDLRQRVMAALRR
jgi:tetraacyldisaccharide 4'-kinase